jgi:hypothetical protein
MPYLGNSDQTAASLAEESRPNRKELLAKDITFDFLLCNVLDVDMGPAFDLSADPVAVFALPYKFLLK